MGKTSSNLSSNTDFFFFYHLTNLLSSRDLCVFTVTLIFEDRMTETEFRERTNPLYTLNIPQDWMSTWEELKALKNFEIKATEIPISPSPAHVLTLQE